MTFFDIQVNISGGEVTTFQTLFNPTGLHPWEDPNYY